MDTRETRSFLKELRNICEHHLEKNSGEGSEKTAAFCVTADVAAENTSIIQSERLDLIPLTPPVLRAVLAGNQSEVGELLGISPPASWLIPRYAMELRLSQLEANPSLQPWLVKAISLREQRILVGDIGFHTEPGAEYLAELSPGGVEFGYGVMEPWRRQGIALEASEALMGWARETHQVQRFVLSISPDNLPSLGMAAKLGFRKIGSQIDELDGPEDIFEKSYAPT